MEPVSLLSSIEIPRTDLIAFFSEAGVEYTNNPHMLSNYFLHTGDAYVWIVLDIIELHYPNPEIDALIEQKLDGPPRTKIILYINSSPEGSQLALGFAILFAQRWPADLDNLSGRARRIYTSEEMQALREQGRGLWDDDNLIPLPEDEFASATFISRQMEEQYTSQGKPLPDWMVEEYKRQGLPLPGEPRNEDNLEDYMAQIRKLLNQGLKMEAIKLYREHTRVGLKEAKQTMDRMEEEMK